MEITFNHVVKEKALTLFNSLGLAKSRIHLYDYKGEKGKDPFAIYAKKIEGKAPELTIFEKTRFIIQKDPNNSDIYYKINKSSLQKRLKISSKELNAVKDGHYENLIQKKLEKALKIEENPYRVINKNPTWEGKFLGIVEHDGDWTSDEIGAKKEELTINPPYSPVFMQENYQILIKNVVHALQNNFDGTAFDTVFIHQTSRKYGGLRSSEGALLELTSLHDPNASFYEENLKMAKYYYENIFYNPKAIIVTVQTLSRDTRERDNGIPENATCAVYTMTGNEYKELPRISENLKQFMKEHQSKLNSMNEEDFKNLPKGSEKLEEYLIKIRKKTS